MSSFSQVSTNKLFQLGCYEVMATLQCCYGIKYMGQLVTAREWEHRYFIMETVAKDGQALTATGMKQFT